jgi:hypothetical protein
MQVYVLLGDMGYDGQEVLGVYASRLEAIDAAVVYQGDFAREGYLVEQRELGAAAQEGFLSGRVERLVLTQQTAV